MFYRDTDMAYQDKIGEIEELKDGTELKAGQRLIYWPSTKRLPEPCEVVRELDTPGRYGERVEVRFADAMLAETTVVYTRSLYVPAHACRVCGCINEWGCEGGCWWVEPNLCSSCLSDEEGGKG